MCKKSIILENIETNQILNTSITPKHIDFDSKALLVFIVQKLPIFNQIIFRYSEYITDVFRVSQCYSLVYLDQY